MSDWTTQVVNYDGVEFVRHSRPGEWQEHSGDGVPVCSICRGVKLRWGPVSSERFTVTDILIGKDGETLVEWHEGDPEPKPTGSEVQVRVRDDGIIEVTP